MTQSKPSKFHSNRKLHNWLIYNIGDKYMEKYSHLYKGDVVDLGCGEAPYREYFLQYADSYLGVDWAESIHDTKADVVADLNKPIEGVEDAKADTVVSIATLEHLSEPQVMLDEAFRILKPGGMFMMQTPWQWMTHEAPYDFFRYSEYGLKHIMEKAGFTDVKIEAQSGFFTMWFLKFNYFTSRLARGPKVFQLLVEIILGPIWCLLQLLAPLLDKVDNNWSLDTLGYITTGKKP